MLDSTSKTATNLNNKRIISDSQNSENYNHLVG